jgi:magnesium-transporting ATPase (P-type)
LERSQHELKVKNLESGKIEKYELCMEFPFDSTRKRMTLIVRYNGVYILMCKGADSIILPRISISGGDVSWQKRQFEVQKSLLNFAKEGLRTLVVGSRILDYDEFDRLKKDYDKLKLSTAANKERKLNDLYDRYETNLTYLGSTAIEDKLQYGVPESIDMLI